ncbi:MAG: hypothetical protein QME75_12385 [Deltaproteobacteria bacterium]|nr:hypothetical protein [Deltaproteobacteria bacterium]
MTSGLKFWEKRPGQWRLDHPNFREVHETTFAKGIIKEFQILQENPIQVASMVKVEINGELHDKFIPLFYTPRAKHWDGEEVQATDFDPEQGAFKQAWQSFRAGDEVAVLLKQGEARAVLGHYDNCPRLGENAFRVEFDSHPQYIDPDDPYTHWFSYYCAFGDPTYHVRMGRFDGWDEWNSQDGGMNREFDWEIPLDKICAWEESKSQPNIYKKTVAETYYLASRSSVFYECHGYCLPPTVPPDQRSEGHYFEAAKIIVKVDYEAKYYRDVSYFRVGPILFAHVTNYLLANHIKTIYRAYHLHTCGDRYHDPYEPPPVEEWELTEVGPSGSYTLPYTEYEFTWDLDAEKLSYESAYEVFEVVADGNESGIEMYAAVCTPELWESPDISQMTRQDYIGWWWNEWTVADPKSFVFKVPPHSKEALMAAGWWPEGEQQ